MSASLACPAPAGYPRIVENPSLKAVEKGRGTVMICGATGNPDPVISWLKDSVPVDMADQRLQILPSGAFAASACVCHCTYVVAHNAQVLFGI